MYENDLFEQVDRSAANDCLNRAGSGRSAISTASRDLQLRAKHSPRHRGIRSCLHHLCVCLDCRAARFHPRATLGLAGCPDYPVARLDRPSALRLDWAEEHEVALRQTTTAGRRADIIQSLRVHERDTSPYLYPRVRIGAPLRLTSSGAVLCRKLRVLSAGDAPRSRLEQRWRVQAVARRSSRPRWHHLHRRWRWQRMTRRHVRVSYSSIRRLETSPT